MNQEHFYHSFINSNSVSKTIRFALIPQRETFEHIEAGAFLSEDEKRANDYTKIKPLIDDYHKHFIDECMRDVREEALSESPVKNAFTLSDLESFAASYATFRKERQNSKGKDLTKAKDTFEAACTTLRKKLVARSFHTENNEATYKELFQKGLFTHLLHEQHQGGEQQELIEQFRSFTTYFTGFHENRKNLYTHEDQSTAIAYRLVNENLLKFLDNQDLYLRKHAHLAPLIEAQHAGDPDAIQRIHASFTLRHYLDCLTQSGITAYNATLGGRTLDSGIKEQGLNELINLHNQKLSNKKERIPSFKMLFKQILSDRESLSFLPEGFASAPEMYDALSSLHRSFILDTQHPLAHETGSLPRELMSLYQGLATGSYDSSKIYIHQSNLRKVSALFYDRHYIISDALLYQLSSQGKKKPNEDKLLEQIEKKAYHSLAELQDALSLYASSLDEEKALAAKLTVPLAEQFAAHYHTTLNDKRHSYGSALTSYYSTLKGELETEHPLLHRATPKVIADIKTYMDCFMDMLHYAKLLSIQPKDQPHYELDTTFYSSYAPINEELFLVTRLYDKIRNYATKKPYSEKKFKLNFKSVTLANGWAQGNEHVNLCLLFRKGDSKYLGIIHKDTKAKKTLFDSSKTCSPSEAHYEKMVYDQIAGSGKTIPKCSIRRKDVIAYFAAGNEQDFILDDPKNFITPLAISKRIYDLYPQGADETCKLTTKYKKLTGDEQGFRAALNEWFAFCLAFLKAYRSTSIYDLSSLKPFDEYSDMSEFSQDIDRIGYSLRFESFSSDYIHQLVREGKLLLFKISNKDYNAGASGTPNLHTLYWNSCFSPENLARPKIKLNGEAELFYRRSSIHGESVITHKEGSTLINKTTRDGEVIPDTVYHELMQLHAGKLHAEQLSELTRSYSDRVITKQATHDITKDRRYTRDQFLFHVPLTLNFQAPKEKKINDAVNQAITDNKQVNIIGIDRGERHLLYLTVINQDGHILEQRSLNTLRAGNLSTVDYHSKLNAREKERDHARKAWGNIEQIAQLKEGYLSHVIHEICTLAEKYQAIIVLEDLNFGFKRGRFKVEKQVYQKFEKALIIKLNYLCFKNRVPQATGGITQAYQLTAPFVSFQKMSKQNGILYYLPAAHTSKIDPITGYIDRLKPRYQNREQARAFFSKMEDISYNESDDCFDFTYHEKDYVTTGKKQWTVKTWGGIRYRWNKQANNNKGATEPIDVTERMKQLLTSKGIEPSSPELKQQLASSDDAALLREMMSLLALVLSMRYSYAEHDYILSPVAFASGQGYDSRLHGEKLPANADANGAYHIARKGLLMLQRLRAGESNAALIKNEDWYAYVQSEPVLAAQIAQITQI